MPTIGKCPSCETSISEMKTVPVPAKAKSTYLKAIAFVCPSCGVVLGVETDPVALVEAIAGQVALRLRD